VSPRLRARGWWAAPPALVADRDVLPWTRGSPRSDGQQRPSKGPARQSDIGTPSCSICGAVIMIGDPDGKLYSEPRSLGRCTAGLHIFTDDNEALFRRATRAPNRSNRRPICSTGRARLAFAIHLGTSGSFSPDVVDDLRHEWEGTPDARKKSGIARRALIVFLDIPSIEGISSRPYAAVQGPI
jgi:hypothetical protein